MNSRRRHALQALAALALATSAGAWAQAWPNKPLKIVVPNAAGGTSDIIARLISKPLSDALGVPVIVENRGGAGGNIGAAAVAQATDQHTILLCDVGGLAIAPLAYKNLAYDPARDLQGVDMLAYAPYLLVVPATLKASNLKELIALSKAERLSAAVPGTGTPNHLATMQLAQLTGLRWQYVPYKGGAPAVADTMANNTQAVLNGMPATLPLVQGGKLRVIGVSKATRSPLLPDVPTLAEQGVADFVAGTWQGVTVSSKMPREQVARLGAELSRIVQTPAVRAALVEAGMEVSSLGAQETTELIASERTRWAAVVKQAGGVIEGAQ